MLVPTSSFRCYTVVGAGAFDGPLFRVETLVRGVRGPPPTDGGQGRYSFFFRVVVFFAVVFFAVVFFAAVFFAAVFFPVAFFLAPDP